MAAVTYAIRAGGFWLLGYVPLTPRVRSMLNALPGAVIASMILPLAVAWRDRSGRCCLSPRSS